MGASKKIGNLTILAEFRELLSDKISVIKTTFTNMFSNSGERNDDSRFFGGWDDSI